MRKTSSAVLLGQDLNAYGVAISLHETYGIRPLALGRYRTGICATSKIVKTEVVPALYSEGAALSALETLSRRFRDERPLLIPCTDAYLSLVVKNQDKLSALYRTVVPDASLYETVSEKYKFYHLLDRYGIRYPDTQLYTEGACVSVAPPWVLKPADSVDYYAHPFDGMEKVYFPKTKAEADDICRKMRSAGYRGRILLQTFIRRERAYVLSVMADRVGGVRAASLAEVVLEELAPNARGNYCALLVRPLNDMAMRLIEMCEQLHYHGIANFDLLQSDGTVYCLEMNPRQGRSSDYLRGAGHSMAAFFEAASTGREYPRTRASTPIYWHAVPHRTVMRLATPTLAGECEQRVREGFDFSPFRYDKDYRFDLVRRLYVAVHESRRSRALIAYADRP